MNGNHPGVDRLRAYSLGKCPAREVTAIYRHLAECTACMTVLDGLSCVDPFVVWLRKLLSKDWREAGPMPNPE